MKKTPWFDGSVKPCADRIGFYESLYDAGTLTQQVWKDWWDGVLWRYGPNDWPCFGQNRPWRGLTKEAK